MSELQDKILQGIDALITERLRVYQADRTVVVTFKRVVDEDSGRVKVDYNGGECDAYNKNGVKFQEGEQVYMLIPSGNTSSKKIIFPLSGIGSSGGDGEAGDIEWSSLID